MLSVVLAASNVPYMYRPANLWGQLHRSQVTEGFPPPKELADESDADVEDYLHRIDKGLTQLRGEIERAKPDALLVLGYDDGTCFNRIQVPQFCTYTGEEFYGSTAVLALGEKPEDFTVTQRCSPSLAWRIHGELVDQGFEMNYMSSQNAVGRPEMGMSAAFSRAPTKLLGKLQIPIVPIFVNCHEEPAPTGHRTYSFGEALGSAIEELPERVAVLAVGGLSHDPNGPRAGWVDDRLDRWVLDQLSKGRGSRLKTLFDVESDTLAGGTGEIRTWISAAAAAETKGARAVVVDYLPSLRAMTGIGFAYWPCSA
jgi:hypothetical protein